MYHLGEVRWQQGQREQAAQLAQQSLEIMEGQVGCAGCQPAPVGCIGSSQRMWIGSLRWLGPEAGVAAAALPTACSCPADTCGCVDAYWHALDCDPLALSEPESRCCLPFRRVWVPPLAACGAAAAWPRCYWSWGGRRRLSACCALCWNTWSQRRRVPACVLRPGCRVRRGGKGGLRVLAQPAGSWRPRCGKTVRKATCRVGLWLWWRQTCSQM